MNLYSNRVAYQMNNLLGRVGGGGGGGGGVGGGGGGVGVGGGGGVCSNLTEIFTFISERVV